MRILALAATLLAIPTLLASSAATTAQAVADSYGIQAWSSVERVAFTFNVDAPGKKVTRGWVWEPREDRVTRTDSDGTSTTYQRDEASADEALAKIDQQFINDSYWLIFPFHLVWDEGTTLTEESGPLPLPVGEGQAAKSLTIQYGEDGGYTPGDGYDLYLDGSNTVLAWTFRKGGAEKASLATTWSKPETFGPIRAATEFRGEGDFRIHFTGVAVEAN